MYPSQENSYCHFPFYQMAFKSFSGPKTRGIAPCCNMIGMKNPFFDYENQQESTFQDFFHSKPMNDLRKDLLEGKKPECCNTCWKAEEKGSRSARLDSISGNSFSEGFEIDYNNLKLTKIDISTGNNCNLRCRMCNPGSSNKLTIDAKEMDNNELALLGWNPNDKRNFPNRDVKTPKYAESWKNFLKDPKDINYIAVIGGEPFITEEFKNMLETYIDKGLAKDTTIELTTNGTKFTDSWMELLNKFKKLRLIFSIDGVGKTYEYIRHPMVWNKLDSSIDNYFSKVKTKNEPIVNCVLSVYNILNIKDLTDWAIDKGMDHVHLDTAYPLGRGIDISNLPQEIIKSAYEDIYPLVNIDLIRGKGVGYMKYMAEKSVEDKDKVLQEVNIFDRIRSQSYNNYLDERICRWIND